MALTAVFDGPAWWTQLCADSPSSLIVANFDVVAVSKTFSLFLVSYLYD